MNSTPDIGKIIQLIMANPGLVEEISKLASTDAQSEITEPVSAPLPPETSEVKAEEIIDSSAIPSQKRVSRGELLGALKPYVSPERAKAIDSMISVAQILDMMKAR